MQMAAGDPKHVRGRLFRGRWLPLWSLILGTLVFGAMVIGGDVTGGLIALGLFLAFAALFYFGAGNETIGGLAAPRRDERWAMINRRAMAFAGTVVILILIGGQLVELASGRDGSPYSEVLGAGVVAFFAAALWLRFRS